MVRTRAESARALRGGVVAGILGGIVISAFMLLMAALTGGDLWATMKGSGAPFLGDRALAPGFDGPAVAVGLLGHFAVSVVWGVLFGLLCFGFSKGLTVLASLAWGIVVWLGMFYVLLPMLGLGRMVAGAPPGSAILEHLMFGLGVGVGFLPFQIETHRVLRKLRPPTL